jgi:NTP pyrophosphatase (non-canonical NTP hydrolase)
MNDQPVPAAGSGQHSEAGDWPAGEKFPVSGDWTEVAPGVRVRLWDAPNEEDMTEVVVLQVDSPRDFRPGGVQAARAFLSMIGTYLDEALETGDAEHARVRAREQPEAPVPDTTPVADSSQTGLFAELTSAIVENNRAKGWHDNPPSFPECIAMLHSEVSEALEAWRVHGLADATGRRIEFSGTGIEIPKPEGVGSEFADVLIRLLDDCYLFGIDLEAEVRRKIAFNATRAFRHGGKRL